MSREIKFRVWDKKTERFQSGFHLTSDGKIIFACLVDNEDYILSQFTGLLDNNGKEIFEGDILIFYIRLDADIDDAGQVFSCKGQVIFDNGAFIMQNIEPKVRPFFYFDWDTMKIGEHCEELSVGGNIYQNPELLGGENE
jgi:uncharacterized phage protein (TIGR01671 family)